MNAGFDASTTSVSCQSPGKCAAGGFYVDRSHRAEAFVANQASGKWHLAIAVSGLGLLNAGGLADLVSVSCPSRGSACFAGGYYSDRFGHYQGFVVSQT